VCVADGPKEGWPQERNGQPKSSCNLENVLQGELDNAWVRSQALNHGKRGRSIPGGHRIRKLRVVEHVKELGAELNALLPRLGQCSKSFRRLGMVSNLAQIVTPNMRFGYARANGEQFGRPRHSRSDRNGAVLSKECPGYL
jgi:hypothetical protein